MRIPPADSETDDGGSGDGTDVVDPSGDEDQGEVLPDGSSAGGKTTKRRAGIVLSSDTYEQQIQSSFVFVELYTLDLVGRTQIKFTREMDIERLFESVEQQSSEVFELRV